MNNIYVINMPKNAIDMLKNWKIINFLFTLRRERKLLTK